MSEINFVCTLVKKAFHEAYYFMNSIIGGPSTDNDTKQEQPSSGESEEKFRGDLDTVRWEVKLDWKIEQAIEIIQENELEATISMLERRISERRKPERPPRCSI